MIKKKNTTHKKKRLKDNKTLHRKMRIYQHEPQPKYNKEKNQHYTENSIK